MDAKKIIRFFQLMEDTQDKLAEAQMELQEAKRIFDRILSNESEVKDELS